MGNVMENHDTGTFSRVSRKYAACAEHKARGRFVGVILLLYILCTNC